MTTGRDDVTSPEVLVIGEALIDIVKRSDGTIEYPGGSPANVAFGLARLDRKVALLTSIGDDARGRTLLAHLQGVGVDVLPESVRRGASTSTATATIGDDGSAEYDFAIEWLLDSAAAEALPAAGIVHIGSIGAALEPGASAVRAIIESLAPRTLVTYDPNIRAELVGERASAVRWFEETAALCHLVKLSEEDAVWLYPDGTPESVAGRLVDILGVPVAAVTLGGRGSLLRTASDTRRVDPLDVDVVDTIGAGDSYMAALIHCLVVAQNRSAGAVDLRWMGETAAAAAAVTVGRPGAQLPQLADVESARRRYFDNVMST